MIDHLHIQNFKCLVDVEVDLAPLTVLIGPNDSGKSSLLDAIYLLGQSTKTAWNQLFGPSNLLEDIVSWKNPRLDVSWQIRGRTEQSTFAYHLSLSPGQQFPRLEELSIDNEKELELRLNDSQPQKRGRPTVHILKEEKGDIPVDPNATALCQISKRETRSFPRIANSLASTIKYRLDTEALRRPSAIEMDPILNANGSNLASVLDSIYTGPHSTARTAIETELNKAVPTISGISLPPVQGNQKALRYLLSQNNGSHASIPATLASDGVVLVTAFLALAYGNTPEILLIEEPENGLHPFLLKTVTELLRRMTTGEVGNRKRQVIITTHSPVLLNYVQPEEVRIFQRPDEMGTRVTSMDEVPDIGRLMKEFGPGELWYLFGEKELVEGQPA